MMRILIMGTPVAPGNRGVMALGASIVDLCLRAVPGAKVAFFEVHKPAADVLVRTGAGPVHVPVVTCRMSPRAALRDHILWILVMAMVYRMVGSERGRVAIRASIPWIAAIAEADLIGDVRGGDSFSDIYGLKRFCLAFLPVWTVVLVKGSLVHFPQTYGPFRTRTARFLARLLLRNSSAIIARDPQSQRIAQDAVGEGVQVQLSPDVAFALHAERLAQVEIDHQPVASLPVSTIGVNVNGLMLHGGYTQRNMFGLELDYRAYLQQMLSHFLSTESADILLVPHTFAVAGDPESDNEACRQIRETLPAEWVSRVRIVTGDYDAHELKGIIGACDFFVGSRMHSCIAALSQGVPCVGVAYSMKFAGVFDSVGMKEWVIDGRDVDDAQAVARTVELYKQRDAIRGNLKARGEAARGRLDEVFARLVCACRSETAGVRVGDMAQADAF